MFLVPSIAGGVLLAVVLGGKPSRVLDVQLRLTAAVFAALALQLVIFSGFGNGVAEDSRRAIHVASYILLIAFVVANARIRPLAVALSGVLLNAFVIAVNGGLMPLSSSAAAAAGMGDTTGGSVSTEATRLAFLGDVFALPARFPFASAFSVGDVLIAAGVTTFIVVTSLEPRADPLLRPRRLLEPFALASYRRLAVGRLVSQIGDWITLAALVSWIYGETHSTEHVAAILLVRLGPPILGGGVAAIIVDRLPKRSLLVGSEIARGFCVAGALVGVVAGERYLVIAAIGCSGLLAALSGTTIPALVPSLVPDAKLPAANAGLSVAKDIGMVLGGSGAGVALVSVGAAPALIIDLVTFAVGAILYSGLPRMAADTSGAQRDEAPRARAYLLRRPALLLLILSFSAATLATGLTNASLPRFLEDHLGFGAGGYGFGLAALGCGLACGGILVGFVQIGASASRWIGLGLLLMAGLFVFLGTGSHAPTALLLLAAIGFVDATTDILFDTVVQREADARYYGSIFGIASALMMATMVGGFLAAPVAQRLFGPAQSVLVAAGFLGVAGAVALAAMIRPASAPAASSERHFLFLPGRQGYEILERPGPAPATGSEVETGGVRFVVVKLARSPLPSRPGRCAYLQPQPVA